MSRLWIALMLLASVPAGARELPADKLFKRAAPSVVRIAVPLTKDQTATGSGVMVNHEKFGTVVVTNCHVLDNATRAFIKDGGEVVPAILVARDRPRDLCLLSPQGAPRLSAKPARLANPKELEVGDRVYAIGAPQGLDLTLSDGLVSGFREMGGARLIQSTAPISHGSSGGGLFDSQGRLVGVTTLFLANSQALNFAVPAELIATLPAYIQGQPEPVGPAFPQWRVVHETDTEEFAVDVSSVRSDNGTISLWTRFRTATPRQLPGIRQPVSESVTHYQLFCASRQWWFDEYVLNDRAGNTIESGRVDRVMREPIQDESFGDFLHQNLCLQE